MKLRITVNNTPYDVEVDVLEDHEGVLLHQGGHTAGPVGGAVAAPAPVAAAPAPAPVAAAPVAPPPAAGGNQLCSQIPGTVVEINVKPGDTVKAGQPVMVLDAMKMNMQVNATADGTVAAILVKPGEAVKMGQPLITMA